MAVNYRRGSELSPEVQAECKRRFIYRYTGENVPAWAKKPWPDGTPYPCQFADDADWLANTMFAVRADGRLDERVSYCNSSPTWRNAMA